MVGAFAYGEVVPHQRFIEGTEIAVGVYDDIGEGPTALPPTEIVPDRWPLRLHRAVYGWHDGVFTPARLDDHVLGGRSGQRSLPPRLGAAWLVSQRPHCYGIHGCIPEVNVAPE